MFYCMLYHMLCLIVRHKLNATHDFHVEKIRHDFVVQSCVHVVHFVGSIVLHLMLRSLPKEIT